MKDPIENMIQMVLVSSKIIEGVNRMDGILQAQEIKEGIGTVENNIRMRDRSASMEQRKMQESMMSLCGFPRAIRR